MPMSYTPACDIEELDTHYVVSFDLPGVKKEDVKIELRDGNQLVVSGERKSEHQDDEANRISVERYSGSFMRVFTLPTSVDSEKIETNYENGVLQIGIPKTDAAKPKQIEIKEGKGRLVNRLLGHKEKKAA